jgi:hypothetical protein
MLLSMRETELERILHGFLPGSCSDECHYLATFQLDHDVDGSSTSLKSCWGDGGCARDRGRDVDTFVASLTVVRNVEEMNGDGVTSLFVE